MLLKRLRDTMARGATPEQTLGEVVRLVANEMVAEVCSIYLLRAGEVLELFATQGLNPDAVHRTRLRVGEGLVGDIAAHARPLALDDAMDMVAARVKKARDEHWEDRNDDGVPLRRTQSIAHLGGATLDNEENYLIKKLFTALGAIQIENQARI